MVNKGSHFADFVRFRPHTYTRTQQYLWPLWAAISVSSIRCISGQYISNPNQCMMSHTFKDNAGICQLTEVLKMFVNHGFIQIHFGLSEFFCFCFMSERYCLSKHINAIKFSLPEDYGDPEVQLFSTNHNYFLETTTFFYKSQLFSTHHNFFLQIATIFYNIATFFCNSQLFSTNHNFFLQNRNFFPQKE